MTEAGDRARHATHRLTPDRVRSMSFPRTPLGRRGLSEEHVAMFQQRVADELAARDATEASLRAKAAHYKNTLVQWQREHSGDRLEDPGGHLPAVRPSIEAVNILSQAQQEADAYVAQTQEYCRQLAATARDHADEILAEARSRAEAAAEEAVHGYRARAGDTYAAELEELERRLVWARTFVTSLETVEVQLRTAREALAHEFERLAPARQGRT